MHCSKPTREEIARKRVMYNTAGLLAVVRKPRGELNKAEDVGPLGTDGTHDAFSLSLSLYIWHDIVSPRRPRTMLLLVIKASCFVTSRSIGPRGIFRVQEFVNGSGFDLMAL